MQVKANSLHDTKFPMALKRTCGCLEIPEASLVSIHFLNAILIQLPLIALTKSQGYEDKSTTVVVLLSEHTEWQLRKHWQIVKEAARVVTKLAWLLVSEVTRNLEVVIGCCVCSEMCQQTNCFQKRYKVSKSCLNAEIAFKYLLVEPFCGINSTVSLHWAS